MQRNVFRKFRADAPQRAINASNCSVFARQITVAKAPIIVMTHAIVSSNVAAGKCMKRKMDTTIQNAIIIPPYKHNEAKRLHFFIQNSFNNLHLLFVGFSAYSVIYLNDYTKA